MIYLLQADDSKELQSSVSLYELVQCVLLSSQFLRL